MNPRRQTWGAWRLNTWVWACMWAWVWAWAPEAAAAAGADADTGPWQWSSDARSETRLGLAWQGRASDEAETRWQQQLSWKQADEQQWHLELDGLWRARGVEEVRLGQAFYRHRQGPWQWTVGRQIHDWSVTDTVSPSDLLNPRDWRDPTRSRKLARPSLSLRHAQAGQQLELVLSPGATASRLPDGVWAPSLPAGLNLLPVQHPSQAQLGLRWSGQALGGDTSVVLYHGHSHAPTAVWAQTDTGLPALQPLQDRLNALALGHLRELGTQSLLRLEWGLHHARRSDSFSQWVAGIEQTLNGPGDDALRLVLQWQGEYAVHRSREAPEGWWDFRRLFNHQLLARVQQQTDDPEAWRLSLEGSWKPGERQRFIRLEAQRRLSAQLELTLGAVAIAGQPDTFWGQYRHLSRWTAGLLWRL